MPGPKMGARPPDFDEEVVRQAPTFLKWEALETGQRLRYACREFTKGHGDDEERLMRRIMIARRNNLRDHEMLKKARISSSGNNNDKLIPTGTKSKKRRKKRDVPYLGQQEDDEEEVETESPMKDNTTDNNSDNNSSPPNCTNQKFSGSQAPMSHLSLSSKKQKTSCIDIHSSSSSARGFGPIMTDADVLHEMDIPAVEATRSYKAWMALAGGMEFTYNQRYIKGQEGHDWLLKKNIWRRMRYRRENKRMVERMKSEATLGAVKSEPVKPEPVKSEASSGALKSETTSGPLKSAKQQSAINNQAMAAGTKAKATAVEGLAVTILPTAATPSMTSAGDTSSLNESSNMPSVEETAAAAAAVAATSAGLMTSDQNHGNIAKQRQSNNNNNDEDEEEDALVQKAAVEAAVAAAESYVKRAREEDEEEEEEDKSATTGKGDFKTLVEAGDKDRMDMAAATAAAVAAAMNPNVSDVLTMDATATNNGIPNLNATSKQPPEVVINNPIMRSAENPGGSSKEEKENMPKSVVNSGYEPLPALSSNIETTLDVAVKLATAAAAPSEGTNESALDVAAKLAAAVVRLEDTAEAIEAAAAVVAATTAAAAAPTTNKGQPHLDTMQQGENDRCNPVKIEFV